MARFHVTLKAALRRGVLYWVADVDAADEDEAMAEAEALFTAEIDDPRDWSFSEAEVLPAPSSR